MSFLTRLCVYCTASIGAPGPEPLLKLPRSRKAKTLARTNVPITLANNVPPTLAKNVPQDLVKNVPPTLGKSVPPNLSKNVPPTLSAPIVLPLKSNEPKATPDTQEMSKFKRRRMKKAAKIRDEKQQAVPL